MKVKYDTFITEMLLVHEINNYIKKLQIYHMIFISNIFTIFYATFFSFDDLRLG